MTYQTAEEKRKELEKIDREIESCMECKRGKSGKAVPGEGDPEAKIAFIGEAPGVEEAKTGRPFVGRSGKYLTQLLSSIGIKRDNVYITSPVKYFPGRRAPNPQEIEHGKTHLLKQLAVIKPGLIVLLGNVAIRTLLGKGFFVSKIHGQPIKKDGITYFPTFHPAAAIRFKKFRLLIEQDFQKLKNTILTLQLND